MFSMPRSYFRIFPIHACPYAALFPSPSFSRFRLVVVLNMRCAMMLRFAHADARLMRAAMPA